MACNKCNICDTWTENLQQFVCDCKAVEIHRIVSLESFIYKFGFFSICKSGNLADIMISWQSMEYFKCCRILWNIPNTDKYASIWNGLDDYAHVSHWMQYPFSSLKFSNVNWTYGVSLIKAVLEDIFRFRIEVSWTFNIIRWSTTTNNKIHALCFRIELYRTVHTDQ